MESPWRGARRSDCRQSKPQRFKTLENRHLLKLTCRTTSVEVSENVKKKVEIQTIIEAMDCIAYYRVSTPRQGKSGLGLEAQQAAVKSYIAKDSRRKLVHEFTEIESGRDSSRPEIHKALAMCKARKARLVIAKLDRLARNVLFIAQLMESKVDFYACDLPEASPLHIHIMAAMAEHEAKMISTRIREALARSKKPLGGDRYLKKTKTIDGRRYKKGALWNPGDVAHLAVKARKRNVQERNAPLVTTAKALRHDKLTLGEIGRELKKLGHDAPRGGQWHPKTVARILA